MSRLAIRDEDEDVLCRGTMKIFTGWDGPRDRPIVIPFQPGNLTVDRTLCNRNLKHIISAPPGVHAFFYNRDFNFNWREEGHTYYLTSDRGEAERKLKLVRVPIGGTIMDEEKMTVHAPPGMSLEEIEKIISH